MAQPQPLTHHCTDTKATLPEGCSQPVTQYSKDLQDVRLLQQVTLVPGLPISLAEPS